MSDVIFAGVIMAMVAEGLLWLIFTRWREAFANEGPVHLWLASLPRALRSRLRSLRSMLAGLRDVRSQVPDDNSQEPRTRRWPLTRQSE